MAKLHSSSRSSGNLSLSRRSSSALPNLGSSPFSDSQKKSLDKKAANVQSAAPFIHQDLSFYNPPADSNPFVTTPNPFPAYPLPGAGPIVVISKTIEKGLLAVINKIAIVHFGGAPPDGTGNVIWRLLKNGAGITGLNNLTSQLGTYTEPNAFSIIAVENDVIQVTAEVPAGQLPMPPGTRTAARFHGWTYPITEATLQRSASSGGSGQ